jgi:hypothetical protein
MTDAAGHPHRRRATAAVVTTFVAAGGGSAGIAWAAATPPPAFAPASPTEVAAGKASAADTAESRRVARLHRTLKQVRRDIPALLQEIDRLSVAGAGGSTGGGSVTAPLPAYVPPAAAAAPAAAPPAPAPAPAAPPPAHTSSGASGAG